MTPSEFTTTLSVPAKKSDIKYEDRPDWFKTKYTKRAYDIVHGKMFNGDNWKFKTYSYVTDDYDLMTEITKYLRSSVGGYEVKTDSDFLSNYYIITSKGYYHYIGSQNSGNIT